MDKKPKKPPIPLSREQELLNENERLRAEVAYLKKLKVLVEERVARESGIGRKPSKD
jgi:transposase